MSPEKKPLQVSADRHFVEYEGTAVEIPKPIENMTDRDWVRFARMERSPLKKLEINSQSFLGLHVVLKDKSYRPMWLRDNSRDRDVPRAFDTLERAVQLGAQLVSSLDDIQAPTNYELSADGHIHRDDVVLAKVPHVVYWKIQMQNMSDANSKIEYQSVEGKAYENVDMPHNIKGNRQAPLYEATEHSVDYQDRPHF